MPKMKSVKGAVKRFKCTKNKIKRGAAFRSHILTKKDAAKMRGLKSPKFVHPTNEKMVRNLLCI